MRYDANFISPTLCGCKVKLSADWNVEPTLVNGELIFYKHPIPDTITDVQTVSICAEHQASLIAPFDYLNHPLETTGSWGYICTGDSCPHPNTPHTPIPVANLTSAQKHYIQLSRYNASIKGFIACKCKVRKIKRQGEARFFIEDPRVTKRCSFHTNDTDHSIALKEDDDINKASFHLKETHFIELSPISLRIPQGRESLTYSQLLAMTPQTLEEERFKKNLQEADAEISSRTSFELSADRSTLKIKHPFIKYLTANQRNSAQQAVQAKVSRTVTYE